MCIRDSRVSALTGETDGWDAINGGVGGSEVFNLCASPEQGTVIDPITDYIDNFENSSFGQPNVCVSIDAASGQIVTQPQDLTPLRNSASLGAGTGDVDCDQVVTLNDARAIVMVTVGRASDTGPCLLDAGGPGHEAAFLAGDVDQDGSTTLLDALLIAQCSVGFTNEFCP